MDKTREQLLSEIKDILKAQYDRQTLKEVIAPAAVEAVKALIKQNPNINLNGIRRGLGKQRLQGYGARISQQDIDGVKAQLGIPATPAQPAAQPKPVAGQTNAAASAGAQAGANVTTPAANPATGGGTAAPAAAPKPAAGQPAAQAESDKNIDKNDIAAVNEAGQYLKSIEPARLQQMNKEISDIGIEGVSDYDTAIKQINQYENLLENMDKYRLIAGALAGLTDTAAYPAGQASPQPAAKPAAQPAAGAAAPATGSGQAPQPAPAPKA